MKQFFKIVFATMTGIGLMWFLGFLLFASIGAALSGGKKEVAKDKTVLRLDFSDQIGEKGKDNPFADVGPFGGGPNITSIAEVIKTLRHAAKDDKVVGIVLEPRMLQMGPANTSAIRVELEAFKKKGKWVKGFVSECTEGAYYLASVASPLYIAPEGLIELNGLSSQIPFLKGMFAKLEVEPEIFRVGRYKSAVEPFFEDHMSAANREQVTSYLGSIYGEFLGHIAASRNIPMAELRLISDSMKVRSAEDAVRYKIADKVGYYDEVETEIRKDLKLEEKDKIHYADLDEYAGTFDLDKEEGKKTESDDSQIAVLIAEGDISGGKSEDGIGSDDLVRELRKLRRNDKVKAVVLRVNSPGGDALASDLIWREVDLINKKKPIIASMGNVAASGGYYISMGARKIFAEPTTITGSIGVFGLLFNTGPFWNNKTGITFDGVKTGAYSDFPNTTRKLTKEESAAMQTFVNRIYDTFTHKAALGRHMQDAAVDSVASGRVWTGLQAKEIGLVDQLGGLDDAIAEAAKLANLKEGDYKVKRLPEDKDFFEGIMAKFNKGDKEKETLIKLLGPDKARMVQMYLNVEKMQGVQARLPYGMENIK